MSVKKIVSGGQTGADQAGLEIAKELKLNTGGFIPIGCVTAKGPMMRLLKDYNLTEIGGSYVNRSMMNVDSSDGTIAFKLKDSPGTDGTIRYCLTGSWQIQQTDHIQLYRPVLIVTGLSKECEKSIIAIIKDFIERHQIKTLNIAGHRQHPDIDGESYEDRIKCVLRGALSP